MNKFSRSKKDLTPKKHLHLQWNLWGKGNKNGWTDLWIYVHFSYFLSSIKYHRKIQAIQILLFCHWFWMTCPVSDAMRKDSYLTKMCRFAWKTHAKPKLSNLSNLSIVNKTMWFTTYSPYSNTILLLSKRFFWEKRFKSIFMHNCVNNEFPCPNALVALTAL